MNITVGVSNRHVHLTEEDYKLLFGDEIMTSRNELNQYDQYATNQLVNLITDKNTIKNVRVLGPFRNYTQIEISKTDSYLLGINPPVRDSGDIKGSAKVTIEGPKGRITKEEGCIIANRHIHINTNEIDKYGLVDGQIVSVKVNTEKGCIMNDVHVKSGNYYFELHIDTDDANANLLKNGDVVEIIK